MKLLFPVGFFSVFFFIYWSTVVDRILHYQTLPNTERFHCIPVALFNFATVHSLDYKEYLKVFFVAVSNPLNFSLRKYERFLCKNKLLSTVWVCVYISILTYIHTFIYILYLFELIDLASSLYTCVTTAWPFWTAFCTSILDILFPARQTILFTPPTICLICSEEKRKKIIPFIARDNVWIIWLVN